MISQRPATSDTNSNAHDDANSDNDNGSHANGSYRGCDLGCHQRNDSNDPCEGCYVGAQIPVLFSGAKDEGPEGQSDKGDDLEPKDIETDSIPSCGDKRPRLSIGLDQWHEPVKVHTTTGVKPRAHDYEVAVQKVLNRAILLYRGYLSTDSPYPSMMDEIRWAKKSWKDACEDCETRLGSNTEIIKLVCDLAWITLCTYLSQITSRSSHFRGRVKSKVQPHIKNMYGFCSVSKPRAVENNVRLVRKLKEKFTFVYAVRFSHLLVYLLTRLCY
jgi:hypothetical protein